MYDTVGLDDMEYDELDETYYYPCPCGDRFEIKHLDVELGGSPWSFHSSSLPLRSDLLKMHTCLVQPETASSHSSPPIWRCPLPSIMSTAPPSSSVAPEQ